ncbi:MAG: sigma-54-dependent Fis family transcriptional regulator [Deltaproteobacteria bacterium]|nr:sigma-54-dependent Fis family transcriptional regulator [Deltaproteobacteria bacterium]
MRPKILIIDDEEIIRKALEKYLTSLNYDVMTAEDGEKGLALAKESSADVALIDMMMPKLSGIELVRRLKEVSPNLVCIVMTAYGTIPSAVEAVKAGAYHYLTKPFELEDIGLLISKALEHRSLREENRELKRQIRQKYRFDNIIGVSPQIQEVLRTIHKVAASDSTILVLGESGTGKELVARAIHYNSQRADKPLVPVNCGAIPEELLESELFGHMKGSFTGAIANKQGRFEVADKGTIFLDEIGDMSPKLQVKILRVLQERKFEPVGSTKSHEVDVRIIAATNRNLEEAVQRGQFREDLFYRLNVIPLRIPPLRSRKADIPVFVKHFVQKCNDENGKKVDGFSEEAMVKILRYGWPGNVRELENLVERMVILKGQGIIQVEDLPSHLFEEKTPDFFTSIVIPDKGISFKSLVADFESELILKALQKTGGNKNKAAALLRLNRTTLVEKIKKKQLDKEAVN